MRKYTWYGTRGQPQRQGHCRLDMILVSFGLVNNVTENNIKLGFQSDHSMLLIDLNLVQCEKGLG